MTKIVNGNKTETNLCEVCAQEENSIGLGVDPNWMLQNIFAEMFNQSIAGSPQIQVSRAKPIQCDQCGFTDVNFSQVGKLGCPKCYEVFENKLDPVLRRVHGLPAHTGKIPQRTGGTIGLRRQMEDLRLELQQAVAREEYEKAAEIRDKIRGLETQLG